MKNPKNLALLTNDRRPVTAIKSTDRISQLLSPSRVGILTESAGLERGIPSRMVSSMFEFLIELELHRAGVDDSHRE